jgi:hypothetical protein
MVASCGGRSSTEGTLRRVGAGLPGKGQVGEPNLEEASVAGSTLQLRLLSARAPHVLGVRASAATSDTTSYRSGRGDSALAAPRAEQKRSEQGEVRMLRGGWR